VAESSKAALTSLANKGVFDRDYFMKPLSVTLTDDDFVEIEELLFVDDDMLRADDPLLKIWTLNWTNFNKTSFRYRLD
jgi:hypothetical protein